MSWAAPSHWQSGRWDHFRLDAAAETDIIHSSAILNNHLNSKLRDILTTEQIKEISESLSAISDFTPDEQRAIRLAFSEGYNLQNAFMTVMTALGLVTSLFLMERRPRIIV